MNTETGREAVAGSADTDEVREEQAQSRRRAGGGRDDFWPDVLSGVMLLFAFFVLIVSMVPSWRAYFKRPDDLVSLLSFVVVPNLVYASLMLILAVGLRRRLEEAWWVMVVWIIGVAQVGRSFAMYTSLTGNETGLQRRAEAAGIPLADYGTIEVVVLISGFVMMALLLIALIRHKHQFSAHAAPRNGRNALVVLLVGLAITLLGGGFLIHQFGNMGGFGRSVVYAIRILLPYIGIAVDRTAELPPLWVRGVVDVMAAATVILAAIAFFKAPRDSHYLRASDEARVRALLKEFGEHDSLGYFATRRDKAVVWDTENTHEAMAGVSYAVMNGVALASGNPVGDPAKWGNAVRAWEKMCRHNGWSLAVMGCGEEGAKVYESIGMNAFDIGDEAIVDLTNYSLNSPGMKAVRQAVSRVQRRGYTTRIRRHSTLTAEDFDTLVTTASSWRGDGGDERGFSMALGRLGDPLDGDCILVAVYDAEEVLRGFLSFVPWGRNALSLDLMRRDPSADNGLVEFMVSELAEAAPKLGVGRVSLNFAMFREAFERGESIGAGPMARLVRQALLFASRNWQLESLYRSNAKYQPDWQPRFICYEFVSDIPRVGIATGSAEGFLNAPSIGLLLRRGRTDEAGSLERADDRYADEVRAMLPAPEDPLAAAMSTDGLPEQMRVRREKLDRLRAAGVEPYPTNYPRTHTLAQVRAEAGELAPDTQTGRIVSVVGRVMLKRDSGKLCFATMRDGSGDMQVMLSVDRAGQEALDLWKSSIDLGDHVGVTGEVITSRRGELSIMADSFALTSKSLRPLPDKHKGLTDPESRARMRYVDLIVRNESRQTAYLRSAVVHSIRESLHKRGFIEVETPMLQLVHGGANARPFETHINAYNMDVYLRIATELHLKRLLVGGVERVFELGRQFRNEGADSSHNPEFTSLEMYQTYADYNDMRILTQEMIKEAATTVFGEPVARRMQPDGSIQEFDLSGEWEHKTLLGAVSEAVGEELTPDTPIEVWNRYIDRFGLDYDRNNGWGAALEALYEELCEDKTTTPVFYMDFPKETAPLTRTHREDPRLAEKWDLVAWAAEQATAYSELIDPVDQRQRLVAQSLLAAAGNPEAMQVDEDFLRALEYGMPPTGGQGMGVDRLIMTLTGLNIRETILFPMVKPE